VAARRHFDVGQDPEAAIRIQAVPKDYDQAGAGERSERHCGRSMHKPSREQQVPSLIWIIIIVIVVLALLGYFGRGRFGGG